MLQFELKELKRREEEEEERKRQEELAKKQATPPSSPQQVAVAERFLFVNFLILVYLLKRPKSNFLQLNLFQVLLTSSDFSFLSKPWYRKFQAVCPMKPVFYPFDV